MKRSTFKSKLLLGLGLSGAVALGSTALYNANATTFADGNDNYPSVSADEATRISPEQAQQAVASAKSLSAAFRVAAERVSPSVVTVETKARNRSSDHVRKLAKPSDGQNPFKGTPFEDFFNQESPFGHGFKFEQSPERFQPRLGVGSGVVISTSGLIMTNNHVVAGGDDVQVTVRLSDGREFPATEVWTDPKTDIAIVKIQADGLVAAKLGNSDSVSVGDWVLALGQPFGLEGTVTAGIVSATHRGVGITDRENFLQTDAAINPGNSGGPLVNLDGEVVGINTAISSRSGGNDGVGFAVPINMANWVGKQLATGGVVQRAYLGVGIQPVSASMADKFQVKPREGVVITEVRPNTPAAKAGLQAGDVITEFAGSRIGNPRELQLAVEQATVGQSADIAIVREGKKMKLSFVPEVLTDELGSAKAGSKSDLGSNRSSSMQAWGMALSELSPAVAKQLNMAGVEGLVITEVQPGSAAADAGLESGMVITQVNRQPVKSTAQFESIAKSSNSSDGLLLLVKTKDGSSFVVLKQ